MPRPSPRMVLAAALALSLLGNAVLVGMVVAKSTGAGAEPGLLAEGVGRAYPAEVRQEFRNLLRENRPRMAATLRELRQSRRTLATAANAVPLDEAQVEHAMQEVRAQTEGLQRLVQELLLEALKRTRTGN